jgi:hypothetical protein
VSGELSHDESGPVPSVGFDYEAIDEKVFGFKPEEVEGLSPETIRLVYRGMCAYLGWVWQDGMKNPEGLQIRSMIVCWNFLPHLQPLELSELARGFGKKKQSVGRWHDQFKLAFPHHKNTHMR